MIAAPCHSNLVKVFKEGYETDKIGILKELLFNVVYWNLNILEVTPLKQALLLLDQSFLYGRLNFSWWCHPSNSLRARTIQARHTFFVPRCTRNTIPCAERALLSKCQPCAHLLIELTKSSTGVLREDHRLSSFIVFISSETARSASAL